MAIAIFTNKDIYIYRIYAIAISRIAMISNRDEVLHIEVGDKKHHPLGMKTPQIYDPPFTAVTN